MAKRAQKTTSRAQKSRRRTPSRLAKARLAERIRDDTKTLRAESLTDMLRKQGYEEIPLQELQDRLSKLRTSLTETILSGRG